MEIAVVGAGSWGTALGKMLAEKGQRVTLWAREPGLAQQIVTAHENPRYLPGAKLPDAVRATSDLGEAVRGKAIVVAVVPSQVMRETMKRAAPSIEEEAIVVSASKGIETGSLQTMDEVL